MKYLQSIRASHTDPKSLETLYRTACREGQEAEFRADLLAVREEFPHNVLYSAWHYRLLQPAGAEDAGASTATAFHGLDWKIALPVSLVAAVIFAALASPGTDLVRNTPLLALVGAPIGGALVIAFLTIAGRRSWAPAAAPLVVLLGLGLYALLMSVLVPRVTYRDLMMLHLPVVGWAAIGVTLLGLRSDAQSRAAFIIKSIETVVTAGLYVLAGGVLLGITTGMFRVLNVRVPDLAMRWLVAGGAGGILIWAVATVYDARVDVLAQRFEQGLGRLIPTLTRLLLPLMLLLLVVYLVVIPFNFMAPFQSRDVLIVYNALLFFVMALLIGVTPVREGDLSPAYHAILRRGVLALAALTVVISLYALAAVVYRTALGGLTINRLTIIGWNGINIAILALLIVESAAPRAGGLGPRRARCLPRGELRVRGVDRVSDRRDPNSVLVSEPYPSGCCGSTVYTMRKGAQGRDCATIQA